MIDQIKKGAKNFAAYVKKIIDDFFKWLEDLFKSGKADEVFDDKNLFWKKISDDIISKIPKIELHQISNDLDELYSAASTANRELKNATKEFAKKTNGKAGFRNGLKSRERALEKIDSDYFGDASRLVDIAGSKVVYETVDDLYIALNKFNKEYKILKIKDRIQQPLNGYRDILMNIEMKNGHIVEFRLHLKEMDEVAEGIGHKLYEERRNLEAIYTRRELTIQEQITINKLKKQEKILYDEVWNKIKNK
ncbi:hypothetical protein [Flavobacterium dankookense]|uniref:hypothetical protein n=1 Tax=Flavobacterium dankookense TaxID=706186 RepID=UPI0013C346C9|nr:hypothetical protein [Flavobacterium dankookense]